MAIRSNTYFGRYGNNFITDSLLANIKILGVKRDGVGYTEKDSMPTGDERKFYYEQAMGRIWFSPAQIFDLGTGGKDVFVLWKE